ncbi:MAG: hypothetical protein JWM57_1612 [Phycisphaerales bacterium]|nr:hypothetical protein [Phycisphaerales bacterium]
MVPREQGKFMQQWAAIVRSLPMICPPMGPTVYAMVFVPLFAWLGIAPWLVGVGIALFVLAPQWDSCILGLMDFLASSTVLLVGATAVIHRIAA